MNPLNAGRGLLNRLQQLSGGVAALAVAGGIAYAASEAVYTGLSHFFSLNFSVALTAFLPCSRGWSPRHHVQPRLRCLRHGRDRGLARAHPVVRVRKSVFFFFFVLLLHRLFIVCSSFVHRLPLQIPCDLRHSHQGAYICVTDGHQGSTDGEHQPACAVSPRGQRAARNPPQPRPGL
jgi:hypothetical protein